MPELSRRLLEMSKVRNGWMTIKNVSGLLYDYREKQGSTSGSDVFRESLKSTTGS